MNLSDTLRLPIRKLVPAVAVLLLAIASAPVNLHYFAFSERPAKQVPDSVEALTAGYATAAITDNYNSAFVARDVGIDLYGTLSWALFREGRPGVLAGVDGWLFSREEFQTDAKSRERMERALDFVSAAKQRIEAAGSRLLVVVIPTKADVYPEKLGRYRLPEEPATRHPALLAALAARGVDTVDPAPEMRRQKSRADSFLHTDTHWTPFGADLAAQAIARHVAGLDLGAATTFVRADRPPVLHQGDLLRYIRVLPFARSSVPAPDKVTPFEALRHNGGDDLFGDTAVPVALVGTSYSANALFSFEAALKIALSHDVVNVAKEGQGPFAPMRDYLSSEAFTATPPALVIWEIPERYVDDAYEPSVFALPAPPATAS
jgi:alginate O-acetyltransferase complex protein AlgJ